MKASGSHHWRIDRVTVSDAIRSGAEQLSATSDTARLDAELLMSHALRATRSEMLIRWMREPAPAEFPQLIARRARHEPVAYITGVQEFYGRPFKVTRDTLIPRPDSETIVDAALDILTDPMPGQGEILDLGTGTGALLLSVLAERPEYRGHGIDRSEGAIAVAQENAALLKLDGRARFAVDFWHGEQDERGNGWADGYPQYDLVLANPPYVEDDAELDAQVKDFEPHSALFAGGDGLDDYRIIIPGLRHCVAPDGAAILEIGHTQADGVSGLAQVHGFDTETRNDLAGRARAVVLRPAWS